MTRWTPRPQAFDEPACWSWALPSATTYADEMTALLAANAAATDPDERRDPAALAFHFVSEAAHRFDQFHDDRCAVCGRTPRHLVLDHCHTTGQWRGMLCRSCNVREGRSSWDVLDLYRAVHPAAILDLHELYTGVGWEKGWCWMESGDAARTHGHRPATPWPAWDLDDLLQPE